MLQALENESGELEKLKDRINEKSLKRSQSEPTQVIVKAIFRLRISQIVVEKQEE